MDKTKDNNIINFPDTHDNKYHKTPRKSSKSNNLTLVILACLFFLIVGIIFLFSDSTFNATNVVNSEPISILNTTNYCFADYKEGYVLAKDGKISCYNTDQKLQWEFDGSKTAPTVVTNGKYVLTYYKKDNLAVVTNGKTTRKINTDGNVAFASVNSKGYTTFLVNEDGFKSQLAVYDNKGNLKFKWHNSDKYITSAYLSNDNKTLIASEVRLIDSGIESQILVTNIKKQSDFKEYNLKDTVICSLHFIAKNKFLAVLDNKTVCYTTDMKEKWQIDYSSENLYTYDISNSNHIAFVFGKDDSMHSESYVDIYNNSGKKTGNYTSDKRINKIDMQGKTTLITYDRGFEIINNNGKVISGADLNYDIHNSIFIGNKKCALILSGSSATLVKPDKR